MKPSAVVLVALVVIAAPLHAQPAGGSAMATPSGEKAIVVTRSEAQSSRQGPAENFTGSVRVDQQFQASAPGRVFGARVTFEPGARTAWHSHPLGQTLIRDERRGPRAAVGRPRRRNPLGDVVWIPPGQKHWHGASPTTRMAHIAIVEQLDAKSVDWMEKVTGAPLRGGSSRPSPPSRGVSFRPPALNGLPSITLLPATVGVLRLGQMLDCELGHLVLVLSFSPK